MRNERRQRRTFRDRIAERHAIVQGLVAGAAIAGYGVGTAKAHVVPVYRAAKRKLAGLVPEGLRLTGEAYRSAVDVGYDEEKARMAERAARRAWSQAKAMMRHAFGA